MPLTVLNCPFWVAKQTVLVGNPIRLASGANRVMLVPDGRRSHISVDRTDQLISLKGTA